jgi:hypothetical protein
MDVSDSGSVIVATRFSRLRPRAAGAPPSVDAADLYHESLSALAEALELLSATLSHWQTGAPPDDSRLCRLQERLHELQRLTSSPAPAPSAPQSAAPTSATR